MVINFSDALPADILTTGLVFSRFGAMVMTLPTLGDAVVPPRARLMLALGLTLVMAPAVSSLYPAAASTNFALLSGVIMSEVVIGVAIGMMLRMVLSAVQVAGNLIATQ